MASSQLHIFDEENPHRDGTPEFWGKAPQSSCNDPHLIHSDRTVLSVLSFLARATHPIVMATQEDVAARAGMKVRNLQLCYKRLEKTGWIERQKGPRNWCTPTQITLLFELRGFQLANDPPGHSVHKRTKAQSDAPTEAQCAAPTKAQSDAPTEAQSDAPRICINREINTKRIYRRRGGKPPHPGQTSGYLSFGQERDAFDARMVAYTNSGAYKEPGGELYEYFKDEEGGDT